MAGGSAYPSYRASGLPWMPSVPIHWNMVRAKNLASLIQTGPFGSQLHNHDYVSGGIPVINPLHLVAGRIKPNAKARVSKEKVAELSRHKLQLGDIVFARRGDLGRSAVVTEREVGWLCGTGSMLFRPLQEVHPEFISRLIGTPMYKGLLVASSIGSTMANLNPKTFSALPIVLPPRPEQDQIVAFLRAQDAHIARFIKAKRELIKLLTEQKLTIIDHAVTRGLDPNVRLKPSGIEWLGEVPEHWEVALIKHIADVRFSGVDKHSHNDEMPVRLCNYTDVYKNDRITEDMDLMRATATAAEIARLTLKAGDVILTKDSETPDDIGVPAWVPEDLPGVVCAYHLGLLRPVPHRVLGEFLFRSIGSARTAQQFHVLATGVTRFALSKHDVKNAVIALPPIEEQQAICRWITDECQPLDDAITRAEEEIQLIREYRDRLIADVVTGQIDVRGWRPGPDDVVSDEELAALGDDEADLGEDEPGDDGE